MVIFHPQISKVASENALDFSPLIWLCVEIGWAVDRKTLGALSGESERPGGAPDPPGSAVAIHTLHSFIQKQIRKRLNKLFHFWYAVPLIRWLSSFIIISHFPLYHIFFIQYYRLSNKIWTEYIIYHFKYKVSKRNFIFKYFIVRYKEISRFGLNFAQSLMQWFTTH